MNIGLVVHHFERGDGTSQYAVELATRFAAAHDVTVYAARVKAPVPDSVDVVRVPAVTGRAYATILSFPRAFARVRRRHDVVHAQGWVTDHADVVTTHIVLAAWRAAIRAVKAPTGLGERLLGGFVARREGGLVRRAARVIAPSGRARDDIGSFYGRTEGVDVVHHGFPTPAAPTDRREARAALGLPRDAFVALYVGDARKGLDAALRGTAAAGPWSHLLVVSRSDARPWQAAAASAGMTGRLHWTGPLDSLSGAYGAADALVHPTIYDTFGLVVAEAMAVGLPVVVSDAAGAAERIVNRESGVVIAASHPVPEIAEALRWLRTKPDACRALGAAARETARARTWDAVARETLAVYERALERRR